MNAGCHGQNCRGAIGSDSGVAGQAGKACSPALKPASTISLFACSDTAASSLTQSRINMSYQPMPGWCMGSTDLKRPSARNCAELTLFSPPRLRIPSVTMSSTHGVSRSTCRLHIPSSPCCGRCPVSRVPIPALRAGSFFLLLESPVRALGQTNRPLRNRWLRRHCCRVRLGKVATHRVLLFLLLGVRELVCRHVPGQSKRPQPLSLLPESAALGLIVCPGLRAFSSSFLFLVLSFLRHQCSSIFPGGPVLRDRFEHEAHAETIKLPAFE